MNDHRDLENTMVMDVFVIEKDGGTCSIGKS